MYIVTGGAGFIGSNLVRGLNRRGIDDIVIVDDLTDGEKHLNLNALRFRDYIDYRELLDRLDQWSGLDLDAVFHQGACSDTTERDGRYMLEVNFEFSKSLLHVCLGHCPLIYASSAATYGNGEDGFREEPECEWPLNVYGYSKKLFDDYVRRQLPTAATQVVGLRYFNVYGPQENHKGRMASVVNKFHRQAGAGEPLRIFAGSEGFLRDFVYVEDCVDVNLSLLDRPEVSGIYNCGSGRAESFRRLAEITASHYPGAVIEEIPFPEDLAGKYQTYTQADLTRLREQAGWTRETTSLEDGVAAYVAVLQASGGYHRRPASPEAPVYSGEEGRPA